MEPLLTRNRLQEILSRFPSLKIGLCGDLALDAYWYADMTRAQLSRETPLYNRPVVSETYSPGGGANVAWNLAALGVGVVQTFSVIGADWRGALLKDIFKREGIRTESLVEAEGWKTPFYGKVVLTNGDLRQEDARLDMINAQPLSPADEERFIKRLQQDVPQLDALILADYFLLGVLTPRVVQALHDLARQHPRIRFLADSRDQIARFSPVIIKPNLQEATQFLLPGQPPETVSLEEIRQAAQQQSARSGQPVYITLGERGCLLCEPEHSQQIPAMRVPPPVDPVGAGDTFLAGLGAALAAGATTREAGSLANLCAAVIIQKIGVTGTASPPEILSLFDRLEAAFPAETEPGC